ncbi:MAG: fatty acid desaturase family protein [Pseudomonadales bacterium]|nr:fatty acid desaturase family protein [Pseudomonadales bacterium]
MNLREILTPEEFQSVTASSDLRGAWLVVCQWAIVVAIFAVAAHWPNPVTILLAVWLLGGRQLGFGVLVHECGHRSLFRTQRLNELVGDWLVAPPTFNNVRAYMRGHLHHHRLAGTHDDPDLPNYRDYPITRARLRRKLLRDLSGRTGLRTLRGIGRGFANLRTLSPESRASLLRGGAVNALMLGIMALAGTPWLYLLWVTAFIFANPLISRIRQVAEHGAVPDLYDTDPRRNTRTLRAGWLARLVFCPHQVNYHLEHHLLASVPIYRLRRLHRLLEAKGFYAGVRFPTSYWELLRQVTFRDAAPAAA